jgi:hypothetical protein
VEDAAESLASSHVEVGDRHRQGVQRTGVDDAFGEAGGSSIRGRAGFTLLRHHILLQQSPRFATSDYVTEPLV